MGGIINLEEIKQLTSDQINGHLSRKDSEHRCEACGHTEWIMQIHDDGSVVFVSMPLTFQLSAAYVFLPLACGRCANTRFINAGEVCNEIRNHERGKEGLNG